MPSTETRATTIAVLVVDDSPVNRLVAEAMLKDRGLSVETASSAEEAVSKARSAAYALILLDIRMAGADGIAAARQIRSLGGHNLSVPIVALTANAETGCRKACLAAGMNDFVAKPLELPTLDDVLHRWCGLPPASIADARRSAPEDTSGPIDPAVFAELRAGITPESFRQLVGRFSTDTPHRIVRMRAAAALGDHELIGREAHTLKSTAALFGARRLMAAAAAIETMARHREDCASPVVDLAPLADAVGAWLDRELSQAASDPEIGGKA